MKYQKPSSRDMDKLAIAAGACGTGNSPNEACTNGGLNTSDCRTGGNYAAGVTCNPGTGAEGCATGNNAAA